MKPAGSDTIAAIATAAGGGIGIVRVSGPEALAVAARVFRGRGGAPLQAAVPLSLVLGDIVDPESGERIDEAFAVHMRQGRSYTGEPMAEFQCHGGRVTLQAVLRAAVGAGARPAAPGEFTKRAFLSGRIDLSQAEAVAELIGAQTERARQAALLRLHGDLGERVRFLAGRVLDEIAAAEAILDHGDDDIAEKGPDGAAVDSLARDVRTLIAHGESRDGRPRGPRVVVAGRENSGKSSIFNMLCNSDRSIVSPVPGTTRDYIEEYVPLEGALVTLVDTAGLRETLDPIETEGMRRSRRQMLDADLLVLTLDGSLPLRPEDLRLVEEFRERSPLLVLTKADLAQKIDRERLRAQCPGLLIVPLSTVDGRGRRELERVLASRCGECAGDDTAAPNVRHRESLRSAAESLERAAGLLTQPGAPLDQAVTEMRWAATSLGEITGEAIGEEILDRIFSRFCLGK